MGLIHDEETITNNLSWESKKAHPTDVITLQFRKPQEKFTPDWEWWLTDGQSWFGLLIQAKRLGSQHINTTVLNTGLGKMRLPQIELLLNCARQKGIDPLYVFYNYNSGRLGSLQWSCSRIYPNMAQLGCTAFAHACRSAAFVSAGWRRSTEDEHDFQPIALSCMLPSAALS